MVEMGKYDNHLLEDYTEEEFKQMDTFIDHDRDMTSLMLPLSNWKANIWYRTV